MSRIDLAVIGGDGIGPDVTAQALAVLKKALAPSGVEVDTTDYDLGARRYHATGEACTEADLAALAEHDAILLGAIGDPSVPSGILERQLLLRMRFAFDHYINLRPTRLYPGVSCPLADPGEIDFIVIREGTEGLYSGHGGIVREGTEHEIATETSINTAFGVRRAVRYAFELAASRPRKHLTLVHKHNVLVNAGHLWRRTVEEIGKEFPQVTHDYLHVDAATIILVTDPARFDVIVTDNLFGDIITDEAGAISGGIGLAASANLNPDRTYPSMFEPVHGSAPDIAGQGIADPVAAICSAALLAYHLGYDDAARRIEGAVSAHMQVRAETDYEVRTQAVGEDVLARLDH